MNKTFIIYHNEIAYFGPEKSFFLRSNLFQYKFIPNKWVPTAVRPISWAWNRYYSLNT